MWRHLLAWIGMTPIAVANEVLHEGWIRKHVGKLLAHQISTALLMLLFAIYIRLIIRAWPPESSRSRSASFGSSSRWAFEFLLGRYVSRSPWSVLFQAYNRLAGRMRVLVPLWVLIAPYFFHRARR